MLTITGFHCRTPNADFMCTAEVDVSDYSVQYSGPERGTTCDFDIVNLMFDCVETEPVDAVTLLENNDKFFWAVVGAIETERENDW